MEYTSVWVTVEEVIRQARALVDKSPALRTALESLDASVATQEHIALAMERHETDEVEIDAQPLVSVGEKGFWVSASVFVPTRTE